MFDCRHAPIALAPDVARELWSRYGEPHRAYHTTQHIQELLRWFDELADAALWQRPADVYLAILFHDAIYDPTVHGGGNERASAELAQRLVVANDRVVELILATARHGSLDAASVDSDTAHFLDSDTAILGASPAEFDAYDAAIRVEYKHVPDAAYRTGRGGFLRAMLGRDRIFLTDYFHARLDARARDNIARALTRLG